MIYNVVLVSGIQLSKSVSHIYIFLFFGLFSHIGHYRVLSSLLYSAFLLVIYFIYTSVHMSLDFFHFLRKY